MAKKAKRPAKNSVVGARVRNLSRKQVRAKAKKEASQQPPIPGSFSLLRQTFGLFKTNWKVLSGIVFVYLLLNLIFASGLLSALNGAAGNFKHSHHLSDALSGYGSLISGSSGGSQTGSAMQTILLVIESLVIIWTLRRLLAKESVRVKQAYYQSMSPLIPFLLVIFSILLQLMPLVIGAAVWAVVAPVSTALNIIFAIVFGLLAIWSIYMVSGSFMALYIVTLPDMQPRQALRSAKRLVKYRRWFVLWRELWLPIFVFVGLGAVIIPLILWLPFLVGPVFFVLLMISFLFVHAYMYNLYRGLVG